MIILLFSGPLIKDNDILYGVLSWSFGSSWSFGAFTGIGDCQNATDPSIIKGGSKLSTYVDVRDRWIAENLLIANVPDVFVLGMII